LPSFPSSLQETFGAMAKSEKIAYILDQVRLCLERKDYVRAQILSRKVSPRAFTAAAAAKKGEATGEIGIEGTAIEAPAPGTPSLEQLKLQYYALMVRYYAHEGNYLEICRAHRAVLDTPCVEADPAAWGDALRKAAWYVVLAPRDSDQRTLLAATAADRRLDDLPLYKELLSKLSGKEVLWWRTLSAEYAGEMDAQADVFGGEEGKKRREGEEEKTHGLAVVCLNVALSRALAERVLLAHHHLKTGADAGPGRKRGGVEVV